MECDLNLLKMFLIFYFDEIAYLVIYLRIIFYVLLFYPVDETLYIFYNSISFMHGCEFFQILIHVVDILYPLVEYSFRSKFFIWYFMWTNSYKWMYVSQFWIFLCKIIIFCLFVFIPCHISFLDLRCAIYIVGLGLWF